MVPDPAWRNQDLPTRRPDGSVAQRPQAALDLHYLISYYGDDSELEPQRLLGSTVRTLNARPLVTRPLIQAVVDAAGAATRPEAPVAGRHRPRRRVELVRALPAARWTWNSCPSCGRSSSRPPTPCRRPGRQSVVLLEEDEPSCPPSRWPRRSSRWRRCAARWSTGSRSPPTRRCRSPPTPTIRITGTQLRGDTTAVHLGGVELAPSSTDDSALEVDLSGAPATAFRAGDGNRPGGPPLAGRDPAEPARRGRLAAGLVPLHPRVVATTASAGTVSVQTDVTVGVGQRVALQLLDPTTGTIVKVLTVGDRTADTTSVAVPSSGNHNIEMAPRLFPPLRPQGDYRAASSCSPAAKRLRPGQTTKSGLMVGLGESDDEVRQVLADLRAAGVDIVTLGQYLRPTRDARARSPATSRPTAFAASSAGARPRLPHRLLRRLRPLVVQRRRGLPAGRSAP